MRNCSIIRKILLLLAIAGTCLVSGSLNANEIGPEAYGHTVVISGDISHSSTALPVGCDLSPDLFGTEIYAKRFTVSVDGLPAGRYSVIVRLAEFYADVPGHRVMDISYLQRVIAHDVDIFKQAGGKFRELKLEFNLDHEADQIRGPLALVFTATSDNAKLNIFEVKDSSGKTVAYLNVKDLKRLVNPAFTKIPEVNTAPIFNDPTQLIDVRINDLISRMSVAEKAEQLNNSAPAIPRLGVPAYDYWNEALHGVARNDKATVFPQAIALAATWDEPMVRKVADVIASEGRAKYYETIRNGNVGRIYAGLNYWTPNVNIFRDPRWGRGQETYGEDPYLTARIGVNFVEGLQGVDPRYPGYYKTMATAKHFAVHSGPEFGRGHFNVNPSARDLYETYLPQFQALVQEAGVCGFMSAYNAIDTVPCSVNEWLLTELLRKQWGFRGHIVSDCGAVNQVYGERQYLPNRAEAISATLKAGVDLACGSDYLFLPDAIEAGFVTEADLDHALHNVLEIRFRLGLFDPEGIAPFADYPASLIECPEHLELALEEARESMTLLKNSGILPLDSAKVKHIAVIGPNADSKIMLRSNYYGDFTHPVTVLDGIKALACSDAKVTYTEGCPIVEIPGISYPVQSEMEKAVALAKDADVVIYVGGLDAEIEGEESPLEAPGFFHGDKTRIELPDVQASLLARLCETGKPVVMVNCSGSAIAFGRFSKELPAILQAWYPGVEGGKAVADVLFGKYNPSGRLPVTFYASSSDLPPFDDYSMKNRTYRYFKGVPEFPFGHGLSYTSFNYSPITVRSKDVTASETLDMGIRLTNTGHRDGDEVVQVYFRHLSSKFEQPIRALIGFKRVKLAAGAATPVEFNIPVERLHYWNEKDKTYEVEPGDYLIEFGKSSADIQQSIKIHVE